MTTVVNIKGTIHSNPPVYDVYIGRSMNMGGWRLAQSPFANPFKIPKDIGNEYETEEEATRDILNKYETWLRDKIRSPEVKDELLALRGRRLGCWCKPKGCHGDIIVKIINELTPTLQVQPVTPVQQRIASSFSPQSFRPLFSPLTPTPTPVPVITAPDQMMAYLQPDVQRFQTTNAHLWNNADEYRINSKVFVNEMVERLLSNPANKALIEHNLAFVKQTIRQPLLTPPTATTLSGKIESPNFDRPVQDQKAYYLVETKNRVLKDKEYYINNLRRYILGKETDPKRIAVAKEVHLSNLYHQLDSEYKGYHYYEEVRPAVEAALATMLDTGTPNSAPLIQQFNQMTVQPTTTVQPVVNPIIQPVVQPTFHDHLAAFIVQSQLDPVYNKVAGMFLGGALGDCLGIPHEFLHSAENRQPYTGVVQYSTVLEFHGHKRLLAIGATSDDTQMTLALCYALKHGQRYDRTNVTSAYINWGTNCGDLMGTNSRKLFKFEPNKDEALLQPDKRSVVTLAVPGRLDSYAKRWTKLFGTQHAANAQQSNGCMMRAAPLALFKSGSHIQEDVNISNPNVTCYQAVNMHVACLRSALVSGTVNEIGNLLSTLATEASKLTDAALTQVCHEVKSGLDRDLVGDVRSFNGQGPSGNTTVSKGKTKGWVAHCLYTSLWALVRSDNYEDYMRWCIASHPGADTDTIASVGGAMMGAKLGLLKMAESKQTRDNLNVMLNSANNNANYHPIKFLQLLPDLVGYYKMSLL